MSYRRAAGPRARRPNPAGPRWVRLVAQMRLVYGTTCHLCDHPGALGADHLIPVSVAPELRWVLPNLRPCHGGRHKCPVCGLACNEIRQTKPVEQAREIIRRRIENPPLTTPLGGPRKPRGRRRIPAGGRPW